MSDLAVVVPCHNEESTLGEQLSALVAQTWDGGTWEIIVVDNNSTDGTVAVAQSFGERGVRLRVITANEKAGVAYARNAGICATDARSVALCDGDDVVQDGWVAAFGEAMKTAELAVGTLDVDAINPEWLARSRPADAARDLPHFGETPFARGNNCAVRKTVWEELGGWDEGFVGLEDIEFSLRARAAGYQAVLVPDAVVSYRYRPDWRDSWNQGVFYGRGRPELRRRAQALGLEPAPSSVSLKSWAWLVVNLPGLRSKQGRHAWIWVLANRIGELQASKGVRPLWFRAKPV